MHEDTDLERTPVESDSLGLALGHEALPSLRDKTEINLFLQLITARVAKPAHERQCVKQAGVVRC
jgi:hypothetical protein